MSEIISQNIPRISHLTNVAAEIVKFGKCPLTLGSTSRVEITKDRAGVDDGERAMSRQASDVDMKLQHVEVKEAVGQQGTPNHRGHAAVPPAITSKKTVCYHPTYLIYQIVMSTISLVDQPVR